MNRSLYVVRLGEAVDSLLNVLLLNGQVGESISLHSALARKTGARWGCILCQILDRLVEPHDCHNQLSGASEGNVAYVRAGVAILMLLWWMWTIVHTLVILF